MTPPLPALERAPLAALRAWLATLKTWLRALVRPRSSERLRLNEERRRLLPDHLRVPQQVLGVGHHSCGATHSVMERCNFACTSCYLGKSANATPPLEAEEVRKQLDTLRAFLGPQGKAQITSGEVTLLPREVLGSYVRYARQIGLDPMVMSHGQRFLDEPEYLMDLVRDDGLEKVSIHVDVTQRGRRDWRPGLSEADFHPVRERYAQLIRDVRRQTGRKLHAAHTVTVTEQNVDDIAEVVRWVSGNADAFRMVSFQPAAEVGRTQDSRIPDLGLDDIWRRICDGLGQELNRHAWYFGHPECHIVAPVVIAQCGRQRIVLETARAGKPWDRAFLQRLMRGVQGFTTLGKGRVENVLGILSLCLRRPLLVAELPIYGLYRLWGVRRWLLAAGLELLKLRPLRIQPLAIVVHKFMSPDELDTPLGQERLAACVFQVPIEGRMTPMCELNATGLRSDLNKEMQT